MRKIMSLFLSVVLVIMTLSSAFSSLAVTFPYLDEQGNYHRLSNGVDTEFNTSFDSMIDDFEYAMNNKEYSVSYKANKDDFYYFASEAPEYVFDASTRYEANEKFSKDVISAFMYRVGIHQPDADSTVDTGDYYCSVELTDFQILTLSNDSEFTQDGATHHFYTFKFKVSLDYNRTLLKPEQEKYVADFAEKFTEKFIAEDASDYDKVKTIYDFIVRNTEYDYEVFNNYKTDEEKNSERYKIAHSAYGAIGGNLSDNEAYCWDTKNTITGQKVISNSDQGLAVCEGFSQLFYYLCVYNGIPCHIVDGDYSLSSGKPSDPHEWNYVWLDDDDGARWFQVDTTFAEAHSFKTIDINSYKYFLCGTMNVDFGDRNHQQVYPIYDFVSSETDYYISLADIKSRPDIDKTIIIRRDYEDNQGIERSSFIMTDSKTVNKIEYEYNPDDTDDMFKLVDDDIEGFSYNGTKSKYYVTIPYVVDREFRTVVTDSNGNSNSDFVDCGVYNVELEGRDGSVNTFFKIVPLDMSNNKNYYKIDIVNKNGENEEATDNGLVIGFNGGTIDLSVDIVDKYNNALEFDKDYRVFIYLEEKNENNSPKETIIDHIGVYYMYIDFMGSYCGEYFTKIDVDKIKLSTLNSSKNYNFNYVPVRMRERNRFFTPTDYFRYAGSELRIEDGELDINKGKIKIVHGVDYALEAFGSLEYNEGGTIVLTGLDQSEILKGRDELTLNYTIGTQYDISGFIVDGKNNIGTIGVYNGSPYTQFDAINAYFEEHREYEITDYGDNVNAGYSEVTIKGVNGCKGSATFRYNIHPASITDAVLSTTQSNGEIVCSLSFNGKKLAKDVDYTESRVQTSTGYDIIIEGKGNFAGLSTVSVELKNVGNPSQVTSGNQNNSSQNSVNNTNNGNNSNQSNTSSTASAKPKTPAISKITAKKKALTVSWKKISSVNGYQVQLATDSKFKKNKQTFKLKKNSVVTLTVKKLKSNKKYYVRVRSYKTVKGKTEYSSWSKVKNIKVK